MTSVCPKSRVSNRLDVQLIQILETSLQSQYNAKYANLWYFRPQTKTSYSVKMREMSRMQATVFGYALALKSHDELMSNNAPCHNLDGYYTCQTGPPLTYGLT